MLKKILLFILTLSLIFLSIIPRSTEVINKNFLFLLDHGRDYIAVKNIAIDHKLTLIGAEIGSGGAGFQGLFHGPFYFYFLSVPFFLFGGDPYGGLILMFIFGILTITASFIFAKRILGLWGGVVMALLVAISPPLIAQSRFIWSPHPSSFFIVLTFYFTYIARKGESLPLFLAAFFSAFTYNFETAITVPLSIALILYIILVLRLKKVRQYVSLLSGFITAFLPLLLFELRHGLQGVRGIMNYSLTSPHVLSSHPNYLGVYTYTFFDTFPRPLLFPLVFLFVLLLGILFFRIREKSKDLRSFLWFLFFLIGTTFIIFLFVRTVIFEYYLIHLNFAFIFLFSYVLISSYKKRETRFQLLLTGFFIAFLFFGTTNALKTFSRDLTDYGGTSKMRGKIDALDYIYKDANGEKFGLLVFSPPIYTYPYDYLIWWYGQQKYNYTPHREKQGLFYLLIEKDHSQPWTYEGWLETVIKEGEVLDEVELPSGFIVQKRIK